MPTFTYIGRDKRDYKATGAKKFTEKSEMEQFLINEGIEDYEIFESITEYKTKLYANVSPSELSLFSKQMSVLFFSHMTLMEGVLLLSEQTENTELKKALIEVYEIMDLGRTFAEAISMYDNIFPSYMLNMITIGETSGTLDSVFQRLSNYYEKEGKMRKKIRQAITYPAILSALMASIIILLVVKILPMFNNILMDMGEELPAGTAVVLGIGAFLSKYAIIIIILITAAIVGLRYYIKTPAGEIWYDEFILKSHLTRYINSRALTAKISRSLSLLIKSGVQILNAMEIVTPLLENKYLENKFKKANNDLQNGMEIKDVFEQIDIFPKLFIRMVTIGQSTGQLDEMLDKCSMIFDDEVDEAIEKFTTMIEPILIIVLSLIVGIILLSVMLPMIDIMTIIG